jgi:AAA+ superfamily predicted ATPase
MKTSTSIITHNGKGKTLTAESVAEIAEKPLYRVTCGDIGTDAESVEKYMESVLLIGTIWGCVVLLDEADVFLEERQVTDLARNALVSVFLRVLEYYDGILILTTNRVGTFDEAFKSRIQLAVHYPALDRDGRHKIWLNFLRILQDKKVDTDHADLLDAARNLAERPFNGRQIRNLLWTAAQVAKYRRETLNAGHLETVVDISEEFEDYLRKTHGQTTEERAVGTGVRAADPGETKKKGFNYGP